MYAVGDDPYVYAGTTVLKNRAGIRDQDRLDQFEQLMIFLREDEPLPSGRFSTRHLCAVHRHLFGDVYAWAGRLRTVRIAKDESQFCFPENIRGELEGLFERFHAADRFRGRDRVAFAQAAAGFLATLNAIHPFREGNGRTQLAFLQQIAVQAGHSLDLGRLDRTTYIPAVIESFFRTDERLAAVLDNLLT